MNKFHSIVYWSSSTILNEVKFTSSLSGGKGGQHVNKTNTKAELYWTPYASELLDDDSKAVVIKKLAAKLSTEGELRLTCEESRSLIKNKTMLIEKFYKLLASCFFVNKPRKATKPSKSSIKKRLDGKTKRKTIKLNRKKPE